MRPRSPRTVTHRFQFFGRLRFPVDYSLLANQGLLVSKPDSPLLFSLCAREFFLAFETKAIDWLWEFYLAGGKITNDCT